MMEKKFSVGDKATFTLHTDSQAGYITSVSKSGKKVGFKTAEAKLLNGVKSGEPDALTFTQGGFYGHTSGRQRWEIADKPNDEAEAFFTLRPARTGNRFGRLLATPPTPPASTSVRVTVITMTSISDTTTRTKTMNSTQKKITKSMQVALDDAKKHGKLVRQIGGYWTKPDAQKEAAYIGQPEAHYVWKNYHGTNTIAGLVNRGLLIVTLSGKFTWLEVRPKNGDSK